MCRGVDVCSRPRTFVRRPADAGGNSNENNWHTMQPDEVLDALGASRSGLTDSEVERRRAVHGWNRLAAVRKQSALVPFIRQFHNVLI